MLLYMMSYLDRVNLGNVRIPLIRDLSLEEYQYTLAVSVFFITYILLEIPSNLLMQRLRPSAWLAFLGFTFGLMSACTIFVTDAGGLYILRLALGAAESGFFPGMFYFLSFWYRREERAFRISMIFVGSSFAGAVGGLIAYASLSIRSFWGIAGWQWLFIFEGIPTMYVALITYYVLPDRPQEVEWLTPEERTLAIERLKDENDHQQQQPKLPGDYEVVGLDDDDDTTTHDDEDLPFDQLTGAAKWKAIARSIFSPMSLALSVAYLNTLVALYSLAYYLPSIIGAMGFSALNSNLLTTPVWLMSCCCTLLASYTSDKYHERNWHILICGFIMVIGFLGVTLGSAYDIMPLAYVSVAFGLSATSSGLPILLAWFSEVMDGDAMLAVATAWIIGFGNLGGIVGPNMYGLLATKNDQGETSYVWGHAAATINCGIFVCILLGILWVRRRRKPDFV